MAARDDGAWLESTVRRTDTPLPRPENAKVSDVLEHLNEM